MGKEVQHFEESQYSILYQDTESISDLMNQEANLIGQQNADCLAQLKFHVQKRSKMQNHRSTGQLPEF
jgi:hypothetical protein